VWLRCHPVPTFEVLPGLYRQDFRQSQLAESFEAIEGALTSRKSGGPLKNAAYLVLLAPYLGDPADPSMVGGWRKNQKD
jgi:hypothetical protein